jgi:hypothetical protein
MALAPSFETDPESKQAMTGLPEGPGILKVKGR